MAEVEGPGGHDDRRLISLPLVQEPWEEDQQVQLEDILITSKEEAVVNGELNLDVRHIAPPQRHPLIFQTFESLRPDEAFILINDHDPKPLYYQFMFERKGQFTWEYLEAGPEVWRVRIGRTASP